MQAEVELILTRQLATYLSMPIILLDAAGDLLFFNEAAESLIGRPFEEVARGEMRLETLTHVFQVTDEHGVPTGTDQLGLAIALRERRPVHRKLWIQGLDGVRRQIEGTAFPIEGLSGRQLGVMAVFWEADP